MIYYMICSVMYEMLLCVSDRTASILYSLFIQHMHLFLSGHLDHMHNGHTENKRISLITNIGNS